MLKQALFNVRFHLTNKILVWSQKIDFITSLVINIDF